MRLPQFGVLLATALVLTAVVYHALHLFHYQPPVPDRPPAVQPRLYLTSQCGHDARRLGNKMFAFASMVGIARRNDMTPIIDRRTPMTDAFDVQVLLSDNMDNSLASGASAVVDFSERKGCCRYDQRTERILEAVGQTAAHVSLRGYFQSWRYFNNARDEVRRNFVFRDDVSRDADSFLDAAVPRGWRTHPFIRVGIHIRLGNLDQSGGFTYAPPSYFTAAMRTFVTQKQQKQPPQQPQPRVQFVVCSDVMSWCRTNVSWSAAELATDGDRVDFVFSTGSSPAVDMAILSRCNHTIVSVGSFGWWAAWLANGTTIYYSGWPGHNSSLAAEYNLKDYYPLHWISMP